MFTLGLVFSLLGLLVFSQRITPNELPLSVTSRWIVNNKGHRVKLACANWYGFDQQDYVAGGLQWQTIDEISEQIVSGGFNCVRLPFSLELIKTNPLIEQQKIDANPSLYGKTGLDCMDAVILSLQNHNIMIILDNHMSDANWCCSGSDGNGLWYTDNYPTSDWIKYWLQLINRYPYSKYPFVIGCDLRNELRSAVVNGQHLTATWYSGNNATDWRTAAIMMANQILSVNSNLLMIIEGINYALDLTGSYNNPITNNDLIVLNKIVMSAHAYSWDAPNGVNTDYNTLSTYFGNNWGFIIEQNKAYTAPVWVGEFGICHYNTGQCIDSKWWSSVMEYFSNGDIDWSIWALDGTESTGDGRTYGSEETYGILNMTWNGIADPQMVNDLKKIANATQGP